MMVLSTIPELIDALDGFPAVAKWAGYEDARGVHNWLSRGIPPSYHLRLALAAKRKGVAIDPAAIFGLSAADAELLQEMMKTKASRPCAAA